MEISYWKSRWKKQHTGWHMEEVYPHLKKYLDRLALVRGDTLLVPLCGKSRDLVWLAEQGFRVIGVEVSDVAVEQFFSENRITYRTEAKGDFTIYHSDNIRIFRGDFFKLEAAWIPPVDTIYDKAALIALPPEKRRTYAVKVNSLVGSDTRILLNTFEYRQNEMNGPPFAVFIDELEELFGDRFVIELLYGESIFDQLPQFRQRGLVSYLKEKIYLLKSHKR